MTFSIRPYLYIQTLLWLVFFASIAYFNRFVADDFYFLYAIKTKTPYEIFYHLQFEWNGRFFSNWILAWFIQWGDSPYFLIFFNSISILLLYSGINRLLRKVTLFYQLKISNLNLLSFLILTVFFFASKAISDVWFWYSGVAIYMSSTIALLFLLSVFINKEKSLIDWLILIMASMAIPGSNEAMTIILLMFICWFLVFRNSKQKMPLLISSIILTICFLINYLGNGTAIRDNITPDLSWQNVILYTGYATVKTLFFQFHKTFLPALFLVLPITFLTIKRTNKNNFRPLKELVYSCIIIGIVVFINHLIAVIPLGALSPERITTVSSVLIVILLIRYLFLLGSEIYISEKLKKVILAINTIGMIVFVVITFQIHNNYARAYDKRMDELAKIKTTIKHQKPIYLKPLPHSGYLPSAEITTDTTHFLNVDLKRYFELNNALILKK
ncbi:MAG: hypothetical protein K0B10_05030 [Vicingaceae bacterium]|nr:hypothetical protein [Vicingaceae bacterium]